MPPFLLTSFLLMTVPDRLDNGVSVENLISVASAAYGFKK